MPELIFWLLCGHALGDYALQGDTMAKSKHPSNKGTDSYPPWWHWLTAHAFIHGGLVALITKIWWLGILEAVCHWLIDLGKCNKLYNIHVDQTLHIVCKLVWAGIVVYGTL